MVACAALLGVYVVLSLFNDPRGFLGTDTGGKVATLEVMAERGRLDPDIGYWAERWDPAGDVHPLYYTSHVGERWVNATTLPMLFAGYPLYRAGGYRLALVLPMLGAVLTALAARTLARRVSGGDGWPAFWLVGLASPMAIYALDFWEHSVGVAAMAWAVVLLDSARDGARPWWAAAAAGGLLGAAATLRTEALVYGFVAVGLACVLLLARRGLVPALAAGAAASVGLLVPLAANVALERATVGDSIRYERAAGTLESASVPVAGDGAKRAREAALNAVALSPAVTTGSMVVGAALLALLAFVVVRCSGPGDHGPAVVAAVGAAALYLVRFADGPGFVPGLVATTPLAVAGVVLGWRLPAARYLVGVGLLALPLVWATQCQGGAAPHWAGRYLLTSGLLLGVVGVAGLGLLPGWCRRALVGAAVAVTVFGLVWTSIRTHDIARASAALARRPEPVLVSRVGHLAREAGAFYRGRRWLTTETEADQRVALRVLAGAGARRFALVTLRRTADPPRIPGWRAVGRDSLLLLPGNRLTVVSYEPDGRCGPVPCAGPP